MALAHTLFNPDPGRSRPFSDGSPDLQAAPVPNDQRTILIADLSPSRRRDVTLAVEGLGLQVVESINVSEALRELGRRSVDAIVVDLLLPGGGAVDFCRQVKESASGERIPVIILGRGGDADTEISALEGGADAFLPLPFRPRALRARVQASLRQKAMIDSLDETESVLFSLAQSVEGRDPALGQHCERLAVMAASMGVSLGLPAGDILALQRGGYLHDVGKVAIPDHVLFKPGPLTEEEWKIMKTHTERGEKICGRVRSLRSVLPIIRNHHEKWDGSGYPDGLKGEQIPLLARILQLADIYDALTAERPYKRAFAPAEALDILRAEASKGWRDPQLVSVFEDIVPMFVEGSDPDSSLASIRALSDSIESYRKSNAYSTARAGEQFAPVKLVSGL